MPTEHVTVSRAAWVLLALTVLAAVLFRHGHQTNLFWASVGVAIPQFWSLGVMHNYAYMRGDPQAAPDWATVMNAVTSLGGIVLFFWALISLARAA